MDDVAEGIRFVKAYMLDDRVEEGKELGSGTGAQLEVKVREKTNGERKGDYTLGFIGPRDDAGDEVDGLIEGLRRKKRCGFGFQSDDAH